MVEHRIRHPNSNSKPRRTGFTLVELLIVIVAMAILAGIVIPQVGAAIDDANESAMLSDLHSLTTAIERYRIDHDGMPPDDLTGQSLPQLTSSTDSYGNIGIGPDYPFGPYMLGEIPVNPLNLSGAVFQAASAPPQSLETLSGWWYYPPSGQIWAGQQRVGRGLTGTIASAASP